MKQYAIWIIFFVLSLPMVTNAQVPDDKNKRNYPVGNFDKINLEGNYRVYLYHSEKPFLKVEAPSDDMYDAFEVKSDNGALELSIRKTRFYLNRIDLYIGSPSLKGLEVSGDIKLTTDGYLDVNDLNLLVQGGANVDMSLKAKNIGVRCEGAVVLELRGITDNLSVKISGAGHVNTRELTAKEVTIRVEGVGFGSVYATNLLDVRIEGVGKVTYKGNPEIKRIIQGLGKVEQY
ncbi:MAG TPA: head GIN domain-containing protein [Prolixibacteraceae bacterium]|nr:head GIN domain-containing protein [Prolixibacteraceae bacterium]